MIGDDVGKYTCYHWSTVDMVLQYSSANVMLFVRGAKEKFPSPICKMSSDITT